MRNTRWLVLVAISTSACLGVWACGSSSTNGAPGGGDAGGDTTEESDGSMVMMETGADATDTGKSDGTGDSPSDAPPTDTGTPDSPPDVWMDAGRTLDGAVCNGGVFTVSTLSPVFAWTGANTGITITGTGFTATPKVYLVPTASADAGIEAGTGVIQLYHVAWVGTSQTTGVSSITAIVPQGTAPGAYTVFVVNPDGCAEPGPTLDVVSNPPPIVDDVSPGVGVTTTPTSVTVTGCHFTSNATLSTLDSTLAATAQTVTTAATCAADAGPTCSDGTPLCTLVGTLTLPNSGSYVVRVTDPAPYDPIDVYGDWGTFVVTNPAGNLTSNGMPTGAGLNVGRRALGSTSGRINSASRFVYAIGGEDASGAPLASVEVGPLDIYGQLGTWFVQKNQLVAPRSGLAVVRQGQYLYAIGGTTSTNGTGGASPTGTPLASIERAMILDPASAPVLQDPPTVTVGTGTLAAGTWYYQVSAITSPDGETLGSNEVVANLSAAGEVVLTWAPVTGASAYLVYRSPAANGTSGSEELLSTSTITATTFTDDGSASLASPVQTPNLPGATGAWQKMTGSPLVDARLDTNATIAPDPSGQLYVYVAGGWGSACLQPDAGAGPGEMNCYEVATISADGATLGTFSVDTTHTFLFPRMRHGFTAMTAANGPSDFASTFGTNGALLLLAGGPGLKSTTGATVEYAVVGNGGMVATAWANPGGFSNERDGSQLQVQNGYSYGFLGGNITPTPNYTSTIDKSTTPQLGDAGLGTLQYGTWSSSSAQVAKIGRMGVSHESAYFFVLGGTSNDSDALATVLQILD